MGEWEQGLKGQERFRSTPVSERLVSEPENEGCGFWEWEKGKYSAGCYLGQVLENRIVGLAKCEKCNSKLKLVTVSTSDICKT